MKTLAIATACLAAAVACSGCDKDAVLYRGDHLIPVDQVFLNHDGYTVTIRTQSGKIAPVRFYEDTYNKTTVFFWQLKETGHAYPTGTPDSVIQGMRSFQTGETIDACIQLYKDLPPNTQGYARILNYERTRSPGVNDKGKLVEIHIPANQVIIGGTEEWGGKFRETGKIQEIR
jgi:hypothetical protein